MTYKSDKNLLSVTTVDFYTEYRKRMRKRYGNKGLKMLIDKYVFMGIVDGYFEKVVKAAAINRKPFKLRKQLGHIGVTKRKSQRGEKRMRSIKRAKVNDKNRDKVNYFWKNHYYSDSYFHYHWYRPYYKVTYMRHYRYYPHRTNAVHFLRDLIYETSLDPHVPDYDVEPFKRPYNNLRPLKLPL